MLYCINNPKKTYTGNEPSPKGLGYCASGEKEETEMKGKDGNTWIIKNGRWVKKLVVMTIIKNYLINYINGGYNYLQVI